MKLFFIFWKIFARGFEYCFKMGLVLGSCRHERPVCRGSADWQKTADSPGDAVGQNDFENWRCPFTWWEGRLMSCPLDCTGFPFLGENTNTFWNVFFFPFFCFILLYHVRSCNLMFFLLGVSFCEKWQKKSPTTVVFCFGGKNRVVFGRNWGILMGNDFFSMKMKGKCGEWIGIEWQNKARSIERQEKTGKISCLCRRKSTPVRSGATRNFECFTGVFWSADNRLAGSFRAYTVNGTNCDLVWDE